MSGPEEVVGRGFANASAWDRYVDRVREDPSLAEQVGHSAEGEQLTRDWPSFEGSAYFVKHRSVGLSAWWPQVYSVGEYGGTYSVTMVVYAESRLHYWGRLLWWSLRGSRAPRPERRSRPAHRALMEDFDRWAGDDDARRWAREHEGQLRAAAMRRAGMLEPIARGLR